MIRGVSWTHQRIGDLEAAERIAAESQELGESIGYVRNTAFCKKCFQDGSNAFRPSVSSIWISGPSS